ncbi:lipoprotein signal peptidase [Roseivirga thermotolerans]|uniref:lipoprotein signal peptidase n=1 Tax=Roseivirga thermotolerans TaxID=1758176 RepID=UPI00273E5FA3|nr:lipoprotein signal peptidase [Roseivirga thermotolerans]
MRQYKYFVLTLTIVAIDQAVKLLVHYNMTMGPAGEINLLGEWFKLHYLLNRGMAFGLSFGAGYGKLALTVFRLLAILFIAYGLFRLTKTKYHAGLLWCIAAILGGAIGNLVDSVFYGALLDNAPYNSITPWFHGQVIDMLYFDFWEGYLPDWFPLWGGKKVALLPIFNMADVAILVGVLGILVFQKTFFRQAESRLTQV